MQIHKLSYQNCESTSTWYFNVIRFLSCDLLQRQGLPVGSRDLPWTSSTSCWEGGLTKYLNITQEEQRSLLQRPMIEFVGTYTAALPNKKVTFRLLGISHLQRFYAWQCSPVKGRHVTDRPVYANSPEASHAFTYPCSIIMNRALLRFHTVSFKMLKRRGDCAR